ncbi:MAG: hypothetical protein ACRDSK_14475 [Actinophytocola sp.]|uniref:hypothetical protein n=1 Tax=Actinophytocola sp. TaxID=1872138 RepID=UPI003D6B5DC0
MAKVDAIEDGFRRVRLAEERAASLTIDHPVGGDFGTVRVRNPSGRWVNWSGKGDPEYVGQ